MSCALLGALGGCSGEPPPAIKCEAAGCNDGNPCTDDQCVPTAGCSHKAVEAGSCSDGNPCTTADACKSGACVGGAPLDCNDSNPCTDDLCKADAGCAYAANSAKCDDGNPCTEGDACSKGGCAAGPAKNCDDNNPCTADKCDAGACKNDPQSGAPCDDKNACTSGDQCGAAGCKGAAIDCDDGNSCTSDACDDKAGKCQHAANALPCDDGSACTAGDACAGGKCAGAAVNCDDGIGCTIDACALASGCTHTATDLLCSDDNPCTIDTCIAKKGCDHGEPLDQPCDDGSKCTTGDTCVNGKCTGMALGCDDGLACTVDSCGFEFGCAHAPAPAGTACSDGEPCTVADACKDGVCKGAILICDDANPCTDDACTPKVGCQSQPKTAPCSDGNACTSDDACKDGACQPGPAKLCDDGNSCTSDGCNPATGCAFAVTAGKACSDGNACTLQDACSSEGKCEGKGAELCDDGNPCTSDSCDPKAGCGHANTSGKCDDGNVCTVAEACADGVCTGGQPLACDDGNDCTADVCVNEGSKGGCGHKIKLSASCDDGNACTINDACDAKGNCGSSQMLFCDTSNPCLFAICVPANGCNLKLKAKFTPCSDSNECTKNDYCDGGACISANPANCNDGNACTADSCSSDEGCKNVANADACDDGLLCTTSSACSGGACKPTAWKNCDDGLFCTAEYCNNDTGLCVYNITDGKSCDDGNSCTTSDACKNGICTGVGKSCDDGNKCTADSCSNNTCSNTAITCNDNNPCTNDACASNSGCQYAANMLACNDNSACTANDKCANSACAGTAVVCNDNNACTYDTCDPKTGCSYANLSGQACNDGDACTTGDSCGGGKCAGSKKTCSDGNECTNDTCDPKAGCQFGAAPLWQLCSDNSGQWICDGKSTCVIAMFSKKVFVVDAGTMAAGCNPKLDSACAPDTKPAHLVKTSAYWLNAFEVSNDDYKKCVAAGSCTQPYTGNYGCTYADSNHGNFPVNCVTYGQAEAYCSWAGMRLPTEHELEKAARGGCAAGKDATCLADTPIYPWGLTQPTCDVANYSNFYGPGCGTSLPWAVGGSGGGPYSHADLIGNVSEWTSDWYSPDFYASLSGAGKEPVLDPKSTTATLYGRSVRGGNYQSQPAALRATVRDYAVPESKLPTIGFRCANTIK